MQRPFYASRQAFVSDCLSRLDIAGKSVIDIGCWDGYYSFICERMGAKRVVATDQYSQNWGTKECFQIAKQLNNSSVELIPDVCVYDIENSMPGQKFDIILFLGVYYHLHAPYRALAQIRGLCHEETVVAIEGACIRDDERSYAEITMNEPSTEKFIPTTRLLREMLESCYFKVESESLLNDFAGCDLAKHLTEDDIFEILRKNVKLQNAKLQDPQRNNVERRELPLDRIFLTARSMQGENPCHYYEPPFGLARFDEADRFQRFRPE